MSGKLKLNDLVSFSYLDQNWIKVKDDYEGAFKPPVPGQPHPGAVGNIPVGTQPKVQQSTNGLLVQIAATHSGIVTRNNSFYLPDRMKKGASTFTKDYPKPALLHHKDHDDPVGRIIDAKYLDTSGIVQDRYRGLEVKNSKGKIIGVINDALIHDFVSDKMPFGQQVDVIRTFFQDNLLEDMDYAGLGHIEIKANISDPDAIKKILDGRYITGSVGASTDKAVCSVCKTDWTKTGPCDHRPGGVYDEAKCFIIAGDLFYEEYSFVNVPADRHSRILQLEYNGNKIDIEMNDNYKGRIYEVLLKFPQYDSGIKEVEGMDNISDAKSGFEIKDTVVSSTQDTEVKTKETEIVTDSTVLPTVVEVQKEEIVEQEESITDFLTRVFGSEKNISVQDEEKLYRFIGDKIVDSVFNESNQTTNDWEKIVKEMEKYIEELEGDDIVLEEEVVEDAAKEKPQDKPGGSNVGKYKTGPFCGPSGGAPKGSFPVNTLKRAKAALAYARNAPNPSGIRKCVCGKWGKQLPSCQEASKKNDSLLTKIQRDSLPASVFCGPDRTFPVKDQEHYAAILSILDEYTGKVDFSTVRASVERKGKARGFKYEKVADNTKVNTDSGYTNILNAISGLLEKENSVTDNTQKPALTDEEKITLQTIVKKISDTVGKDIFQQVLYKEELAYDETALLDEVISLENQMVELRDKLDVTQKEYHLLFSDMEKLQDSLVTEKINLRKVKESQLGFLVSLRDQKNEEHNFTQLSDSDLESELKRNTEIVDMNKITDKLNDGMSRVPVGEVSNPSGIQDNKIQESSVSVDSLNKIKENFLTLRFTKGQQTAERYLNMMKSNGLLPPDHDNI